MPRLQAWFDRYREAKQQQRERSKKDINHELAKITLRSGKTAYYVGLSLGVKALRRSGLYKKIELMK